MKKQVNGSKNDRSATILGILHLRYMAQWEIVKGLWTILMQTKKIGQGNRKRPRSLFAETQNCHAATIVQSILWICELQQAFGWLQVSRPSSDRWGGIETTTQTNSTNGRGTG